MKAVFQEDRILLIAESEAESAFIASWGSIIDQHVFALQRDEGDSYYLADLGQRVDACREPINVIFSQPDETIRLISNLAHTPFELDGKMYASVEAFRQGLKFPELKTRRDIAVLHGKEARNAGQNAPVADSFEYHGNRIHFGTFDHWQLMSAACLAKFTQHEPARKALLGTRKRPLIHKPRNDSRTIPGPLMAEIWMQIRRGLAGEFSEPS